MKTYYAKASCGCCEVEMLFENDESASQAFQKAGLQSSASIVDDAGNRVDSVDTFYGFSLDETEASERSLGFLLDKLRGSIQS